MKKDSDFPLLISDPDWVFWCFFFFSKAIKVTGKKETPRENAFIKELKQNLGLTE